MSAVSVNAELDSGEKRCREERHAKRAIPEPHVCSHRCHGVCEIDDQPFAKTKNVERKQTVSHRKPATRARGIDFSSLGAAITKLLIAGRLVRKSTMLDTADRREWTDSAKKAA